MLSLFNPYFLPALLQLHWDLVLYRLSELLPVQSRSHSSFGIWTLSSLRRSSTSLTELCCTVPKVSSLVIGRGSGVSSYGLCITSNQGRNSGLWEKEWLISAYLVGLGRCKVSKFPRTLSQMFTPSDSVSYFFSIRTMTLVEQTG